MLPPTFWTNTIWYVLLGVVTLFELIYVTRKTNKHGLVWALYLTFAGILFNCETLILIFLKSYTYYPLILKNPPFPFDDSLAGNVFSQTSVSATALLTAVLDLKLYWYFVLAGIYYIIEEVFLALGIYSHNWYQTWMTFVGALLYFWITKEMYQKSLHGIKPIFYYGYIYLALFPLHIVILEWGILVLDRLQDFNTTLFLDPIACRSLLWLIHFHSLAIPMMFIYFSRFNWLWKALAILMIYLIYYIGYKLNLILIKDGWFLVISTVSIWWMYLSVFTMDRLYDKKEMP